MNMSGAQNRMRALVWWGIAGLACLSVALINGGGLFYFDTAGYLEQGQASLASFGIDIVGAEMSAAQAGATDTEAARDDVVIGSRSAVYSIVMTLAWLLSGLGSMAGIQTLALLLTVGLVARQIQRRQACSQSMAVLVAGPVLLASLGALPFYTAFLMPDIFAPILLLMVAVLTGFSATMTWPERLFAIAMGAVAIVTHPSHLLIAVLMIPVAGLGALILSRRRWWLAPLCVSAMVAGGMAERVIFVEAVKTIRSAEVVYQPFLTVRSIADGPGYTFLQERCPDPDISACALYDALQKSDDPMRLTASHIMFQTSPRLGSYMLLDAATQKRIADDQVTFFLQVLRDRPVDIVVMFLHNTLRQVGDYNSIRQTIPNTDVLEAVERMTDLAPASLRASRLLDQQDRLAGLDMLHRILYVLSAVIILGLCLRPGQRPPAVLRILALTLVAGILANGLVCGGISQPSDRYGARVAFLLPLSAAWLVMSLWRPAVLWQNKSSTTAKSPAAPQSS